ncbi:hypothetical protein [Streptomyces sp. NPDC020917]|uniref:hypothetical protein n=1 Tax=Streptomyces sp. NPDC020917 TaxID=3365102 RepID=UPI0037AFC61D
MSVQSAQPVPSVPPVEPVRPARPVRRRTLTLAAAVAAVAMTGALLAPAAHAAPGDGRLTVLTGPSGATSMSIVALDGTPRYDPNPADTATPPPANAPAERDRCG